MWSTTSVRGVQVLGRPGLLLTAALGSFRGTAKQVAREPRGSSRHEAPDPEALNGYLVMSLSQCFGGGGTLPLHHLHSMDMCWGERGLRQRGHS